MRNMFSKNVCSFQNLRKKRAFIQSTHPGNILLYSYVYVYATVKHVLLLHACIHSVWFMYDHCHIHLFLCIIIIVIIAGFSPHFYRKAKQGKLAWLLLSLFPHHCSSPLLCILQTKNPSSISKSFKVSEIIRKRKVGNAYHNQVEHGLKGNATCTTFYFFIRTNASFTDNVSFL